VTGTLARPIFVVGCPRSGTTLVQCILSASDAAFSLPETHFFSEVLPDLRVPVDARLTPQQLRQALGRLAYSAEMTLPDTLVERLGQAARAGTLTPLQLFLAVIEQLRPAEDRAARLLRVVEKTPLHVLHLEQLGAIFPDAGFVNVVRGPLDVTASWLATPFARTRSMTFYAQTWSTTIAAAERYAASHPGRVYTLVYERLVAEPEREVRALCHFLGLRFEPRLLDGFGSEAARNVNKREEWKADIERGVIVNRAGTWRRRITPGQAWLVAVATRSVARRYGYPGVPAASAGAIVAAVAQECCVRFREARPVTGRWGSVRHALNGVRALRPWRETFA